MWMGIPVIHSWEMIVMILSRLKMFPVLNIFQSFNPIFHVFFCCQYIKWALYMEFWPQNLVLDSTTSATIRSILSNMIAFVKNYSTHPLFSNVGLDFYVSLASFFDNYYIFLENLAHDWNLADECLQETGVCFGLTVMTPLWVPEAIGNSGERCLLTGRKPGQDKQGFPGRKRGIHFVFKLKKKWNLIWAILKPVQMYRETSIIFSSWSIMFILSLELFWCKT